MNIFEQQETLHKIGLPHLCEQLYSQVNWKQQLSAGEQQRLMFARLLLNRPKLIFIDETTSSLDIDAASNLITLLKAELPQSAIAFISHQVALTQYADQVIYIEDDKGNDKTDHDLNLVNTINIA